MRRASDFLFSFLSNETFADYISQLVKSLKNALQPVLSNIQLTWKAPHGWSVKQVPTRAPPVFDGDRLVLYAIIQEDTQRVAEKTTFNPFRFLMKKKAPEKDDKGVQGKSEGNRQMTQGSVRLKAAVTGSGNQSVEINHTLSYEILNEKLPPKACTPLTIHRLTGKCFIQELQDEGAAEVSGRDTIVALSKAANVISKHTSFVAVNQESKEVIQGPLVNMSQWECLGIAKMQMNWSSNSECDSDDDELVDMAFEFESPTAGTTIELQLEGLSTREKYADSDVVQSQPSSHNALSMLFQLIALQKASGAWEMTDQLARILGRTKTELERACPDTSPAAKDDEKVWATFLALVLLAGKFESKKYEWEMVGKKGKKWLKVRVPAEEKFKSLVSAAMRELDLSVESVERLLQNLL